VIMDLYSLVDNLYKVGDFDLIFVTEVEANHVLR
jgi:hypothetical protein